MGCRLVIVHDITEDGALCDIDPITGKYVDNLKWTGDTCHPEKRADGLLTAERLWVTQSHTGDYHDNMNSDMFMQWLETKLVPIFEKIPR